MPQIQRRHYRIGPFVLMQQQQQSLPIAIVKSLEISRLSRITNQSDFIRFWNELEGSGRLKETLLKVLEFHSKPEAGPESDFTLNQVWDIASKEIRAEITLDFFALNFNTNLLTSLARKG